MPRRNKTQKVVKQVYVASSCTSKRRFNNQNAAQNQADLQMLEQPSMELGVYQCPACRGWHLTSLSKQQAA